MLALDFLIPNLNNTDKRFLQNLAKQTLENFVSGIEAPNINVSELGSSLLNDGACFVTLKLNNQLRGCIGSVIAHRSLYVDVISNTIASASNDPRFPKLQKNELENIKISISILSNLVEVKYNNLQELFTLIEPFNDGLVIKNGNYQGLFLPSVWEELPSKNLFISNLCLKAGFSPDLWHDNIKIFKFRTIVI